MLNACTIDVEDYYHVSAFDRIIPRAAWPSFESRVVDSTRVILDVMAKRNARGAFFVLGWVAEKHPELVREIQSGGHEIGCHSHWHRLIYELDPKTFVEDLRRSKSTLEQITGQPVLSYRAPSFSITHRSMWALEALAAEGIRYDSSIFPVSHDRYGIANAPAGPYAIQTKSGTLLEFPPTVHRCLGMNFPVAGGGYFRLYPYKLTRRWSRLINRQGRAVNLYIHPWEFDPKQPRIAGISRLTQFRHYVNLESTRRKFARFLRDVPFGTLSESLAQAEAAGLETLEIEGTKSRPFRPVRVDGPQQHRPKRGWIFQEGADSDVEESRRIYADQL